ncbi:MAG: flagellar motor switch protein FliN [Polyangiaceae bacterium]|nr:flagellar motor switch protein FliN [Polyangiaceae bacterium]
MTDAFDEKNPGRPRPHSNPPDDMVSMGSLDEELDADERRGHPGVAPMPAAKASASHGPGARGLDSLAFVMDVPVEVTVEIGRRTMKIADVLRLGPGSVLELDKASGEPLDILVNNRLVARGEAVVVGERYGIRLTEVLVNEDTRGGQ